MKRRHYPWLAVVELTAGWPVALLVYRNMRAHEAKGLGADAERLTENYVGARLLRDLSATDRACLLDLAVFDWLDDDLVDEVLGTSDARVRIAAVSSLDGLLVPINPDRTVQRMHPLLRDYCVGLLSVEDPARKRALHGRIALALARRDESALGVAPCERGWRQPAGRRADRALRRLRVVAAGGRDPADRGRPVPDPGTPGGVSAARAPALHHSPPVVEVRGGDRALRGGPAADRRLHARPGGWRCRCVDRRPVSSRKGCWPAAPIDWRRTGSMR